MNKELIEHFNKQCETFDIIPSEIQIRQLIDYYEMLVEKNKVMNLTAITEPQEVLEKHFLDSISIVKAVDLTKVHTLLDVGTGAGFPGIPLKIFFPELSVTLLDSLNKRVLFLKEVCEKLGLHDITCIHSRAEEAARNPEFREKFDLVTSRAVANLSTLSEYCIPFVKKSGCFISYKAEEVSEEVENAKTAFRILGGQLEKTLSFVLPETDINRNLIVIRKIKDTPKRFPRKAGIPSKTPIER